MAHTQRYLVDGHIRTRTFHPERPEDNPVGGPVQKPQPQRKTEVEVHQVKESSDSASDPITRKELCAVKEKFPEGKKKKAPKEKSANPGLFKILFLGGRWAHEEDVEPGSGNRTKYAAPKWEFRPFGGTR